MRLNKYISSSGFCSRRKADEFIQNGLVTINDELATLQSELKDGDIVKVNGTLIQPKQEFVYLLLNKPTGITCTTERHIEGNIIDFVNYPERIFPIGRLDKDSSGLIVLTNDGDVVNSCLREENNHEKEYIVEVDHKINQDFLEKMSAGVQIYNPVNNSYVVTKPCVLKQLGARKFSIILTQGYNRQIRRMCTACGYHVRHLKRIRFLHLVLDTKEGEWRYLSEKEIKFLKK